MGMNVTVIDIDVAICPMWDELDTHLFDTKLYPLPMFLDSWQCILDETIDDIDIASRLYMEFYEYSSRVGV